jgi:hypothetical protein
MISSILSEKELRIARLKAAAFIICGLAPTTVTILII